MYQIQRRPTSPTNTPTHRPTRTFSPSAYPTKKASVTQRPSFSPTSSPTCNCSALQSLLSIEEYYEITSNQGNVRPAPNSESAAYWGFGTYELNQYLSLYGDDFGYFSSYVPDFLYTLDNMRVYAMDVENAQAAVKSVLLEANGACGCNLPPGSQVPTTSPTHLEDIFNGHGYQLYLFLGKVKYVGCLDSAEATPALADHLYSDATGMTIESCRNKAIAQGYTYFGLLKGIQCFGDHVVGQTLYSYGCSIGCSGASTIQLNNNTVANELSWLYQTEICGGTSTMSVYEIVENKSTE